MKKDQTEDIYYFSLYQPKKAGNSMQIKHLFITPQDKKANSKSRLNLLIKIAYL